MKCGKSELNWLHVESIAICCDVGLIFLGILYDYIPFPSMEFVLAVAQSIKDKEGRI